MPAVTKRAAMLPVARQHSQSFRFEIGSRIAFPHLPRSRAPLLANAATRVAAVAGNRARQAALPAWVLLPFRRRDSDDDQGGLAKGLIGSRPAFQWGAVECEEEALAGRVDPQVVSPADVVLELLP